MSGNKVTKLGLTAEFLSRLGLNDKMNFNSALDSAAIMVCQLETEYDYNVDEAVADFVKYNKGAYDKKFSPSRFLDDLYDDSMESRNKEYFNWDIDS